MTLINGKNSRIIDGFREGNKSEVDAFMEKNRSLLKSSEWILGSHWVYVPWVAYHDGFGSHSEDEIASSGVNWSKKLGLIRVSKIGKKINSQDTENFIFLTEEEFSSISDLKEPSFRKDWIVAKMERRELRYREEIEAPLEIENSRYRFFEILRRLDEGWIVKTRNRKTGAVEDFNGANNRKKYLAIVSGLEKEKYRYKVMGTYARSSMMSSVRIVARKFYTYISWEEYEQLPEIKERKKLLIEVEKLEKFRPQGIYFWDKSLDYLRGSIVKMRKLRKIEQFLKEQQSAVRRNFSRRSKQVKTVKDEQKFSGSGLTSNPFAILAKLKK